MSIPSLLQWVEGTDLSTAIREGALPYPILGGVHLLAIALFGGMVLMTDFRLLGWAMRRTPVTDVVRQFQAWKRAGFVVLVASGLLLAWAEPLKLYRSPSFWVKMALLALVGVHALVFRVRVYGTTARLGHRRNGRRQAGRGYLPGVVGRADCLRAADRLRCVRM